MEPEETPEDIVAIGREAAAVYGIPEDIFLRLLRRESGFIPTAESSAGAYGPAQLTELTAEHVGVNRYDPISNVAGGAKYLKELYSRYGDWATALAAYNAGPTAVNRAGRDIPPIRETEEYVANILGGLPLEGEDVYPPYSGSGAPPRRPEYLEGISSLLPIMQEKLWVDGARNKRDPALTEFVRKIREPYRDGGLPENRMAPRTDVPLYRFASGGPVRGSSLDINIFAYPRG